MTPRLTYRARVALIGLLSLVSVWLGTMAMFYRSESQQGGVRPLPSQVAALVRLLERAPASDRDLLLAAATSETMTVRLEPGDTVDPRPNRRMFDRAVGFALADLGGRPFSTRVPSPRPWAIAPVTPETWEIRVALLTGDTLMIHTRSLLMVSVLGLPIGFGAGLFGTAVALVGIALMQREAAPLMRLAAAVDGVDFGSTPVDLPEATHCAPEIRGVIAAFDRLQSRLTSLIDSRMAMVVGISHDVRTFATRLRLRADLIADETERDRAIADIADMIRLLDDALLTSRAGAGELADELIDVAEVVGSEVTDRRNQGVPVRLFAHPERDEALVLGERLALRRIVGNLLDNAIKHGAMASVSLLATHDTVLLTVDDEGPGIPPAARSIVLEPFVRLDQSRSRGTGGAGLGLAVVSTLVKAHGGRVAIEDAPGGGARFVVRLPRYRIGSA